ncbi:MAG: hypothetical protein EOO40_09075, partial [Deltaproteobacteria bacterium]
MRYELRFWQVSGFLLVSLGVALGCQAAVHAAVPHLLRTRLGALDPLRGVLADLPHRLATQASRARIVQFWSPVDAAKRAALEGHGLRVRGYIPEDALTLLATDAEVSWLRQQPMVRAVVDQPVALRLDARLMQAGPAGLVALKRSAPQTLLVELSAPGKGGEVEDLVRTLGGDVVDGAGNGRILKVRLPSEAAATLAEHPDVTAVEPQDTAHTQNDASYGMVQAGTVHRSPLWDRGLHGEGQVAAVCDVGVSTG